MFKYINKIKEKPDNIRSQYIAVFLSISMVIVFSIWLYGITNKISSLKNKNNNLVKEEQPSEKSSSSPFALIFNTTKNAYTDISASVLDASSAFSKIKKTNNNSDNKNEVDEVLDNSKVIDLIPVNHNN